MAIRGQIDTMHSSFSGLAIGLIFSVVLVYLLMVVNFQSWVDPFIIITALAGRAQRHCVDAVFHRDHLERAVADGNHHVHRRGHLQQHSAGHLRRQRRCAKGKNSFQAAVSAGFTRLRPVIMTALAMIVGMIPMSLGIGEGAEQNAPLGRAVIGGLLIATISTLFFVPVVYSFVRRKGYQELFAE